MTDVEQDLMRRLLIAAERNWQVAEDEGYEDRDHLKLFREARECLGLPRREPRFNSFIEVAE
jgi:hypothetical protein